MSSRADQRRVDGLRVAWFERGQLGAPPDEWVAEFVLLPAAVTADRFLDVRGIEQQASDGLTQTTASASERIRTAPTRTTEPLRRRSWSPRLFAVAAVAVMLVGGNLAYAATAPEGQSRSLLSLLATTSTNAPSDDSAAVESSSQPSFVPATPTPSAAQPASPTRSAARSVSPGPRNRPSEPNKGAKPEQVPKQQLPKYTSDDVAATARTYGITYDTPAALADALSSGSLKVDTWRRELLESARGYYPAAAPQLTESTSLDDVLEPWIAEVAKSLELMPGTIDWRTEPLLAGLPGSPTFPSLTEFRQRIRNDERWGSTDQANRRADKFICQFDSTFRQGKSRRC